MKSAESNEMMDHEASMTCQSERIAAWTASRRCCLALVVWLGLVASAQAELAWPAMVDSADGTPISYSVHGQGEPTLVFVHGWSCDSRYWQAQVPAFSSDHRVVLIDLAGHGHSGQSRDSYSMAAFSQDVHAVVEAVGAEKVVLIGHSMGGPVIAEAANLMAERVVGLIGVDTFLNVEMAMTREEIEQWLAPLQADYHRGGAAFVAQMFVEDTDQSLRDWITADMSAAPPEVAISAMQHMLDDYHSGAAARAFTDLQVPVVAINADLWPSDPEANRRHMHTFELITMEGADHFLMMSQPERFNRKLGTAIGQLTE